MNAGSTGPAIMQSWRDLCSAMDVVQLIDNHDDKFKKR